MEVVFENLIYRLICIQNLMQDFGIFREIIRKNMCLKIASAFRGAQVGKNIGGNPLRKNILLKN